MAGELVTTRIRTTEKHPHSIWNKLVTEYPVAEIQGFIFSCSDDELIKATMDSDNTIQVQCLEAAEYDQDDELTPESFFTIQDWINKINASSFFKSTLLFLTHKPGDTVLFKLHKVVENTGTVSFTEINQFSDELSFISWWRTIKKLSQSKPTVEAKPRQWLTIFDSVIEKHGLSWGGNMDGFILTDHDNSVIAIIEVRQTHSFAITNYDPAKYFLGTATKGGDFKTWLPLVYLKKAYRIPIILLTLSSKDKTRFGFTEVSTISRRMLIYVDDVPPTRNVTTDFDVFKKWLITITKGNRA